MKQKDFEEMEVDVPDTLICSACGQEIYACDKCGEYFEGAELAYCNDNSGYKTKHICKECYEGLK